MVEVGSIAGGGYGFAIPPGSCGASYLAETDAVEKWSGLAGAVLGMVVTVAGESSASCSFGTELPLGGSALCCPRGMFGGEPEWGMGRYPTR